MVIDGVRYRVTYGATGPYVFANGKKQIDGIRFAGIVRA